MKITRLVSVFAIGILALSGSAALAGAQGKGNGHSKGKEKGHDKGHETVYVYSQHDRDEFRVYYTGHSGNLPPGLAKKDRLPPGIAKRLVVHSQFPPDLERQVYVVPVELERRLPPPPPDCERVVIGGSIVLRNRNTKIIFDIFNF